LIYKESNNRIELVAYWLMVRAMTAAAADSTPSLARVYLRFLGDSYYKTLQKLIYNHKENVT
jgi:hypothetical protein